MMILTATRTTIAMPSSRTSQTIRNLQRHLTASLALALATLVVFASCSQFVPVAGRRQSTSAFAARRAADDARPLLRPASERRSAGAASAFDAAESNQQRDSVILGKFKAPAPGRVHQQRIPKSGQFGSHTMSASYQVAESSRLTPEKVVHGIVGASTRGAGENNNNNNNNNNKQRVLSAKIQVSDEGLNYPPSKLSADIYGNVAEIVTAPPSAVAIDFLVPNSRRFSAASRP